MCRASDVDECLKVQSCVGLVTWMCVPECNPMETEDEGRKRAEMGRSETESEKSREADRDTSQHAHGIAHWPADGELSWTSWAVAWMASACKKQALW